jgi:hypothetical protein
MLTIAKMIAVRAIKIQKIICPVVSDSMIYLNN